MNNEIIKEIDNIIENIEKSDIYVEYINILNKVNNNDEIKELTDKIKKINKQLVLTPSIKLEQEVKDLENKLNDIPLYQDYKDKLNELNNLLLVVKNKIDGYIKNIIIN